MKKPTLTIDGARGEGGGQIVRSSLALACLTGTKVQIEHLRAGRAKPGLQRQHLAAVKAAAAISSAALTGAGIGSTELTFEPGEVVPGEYHFVIGSAGSATLVLQTVLPALLSASGPSTVVVEGGTHNPLAPPFGFLARAWLPLLRRLGGAVTLELERPGFFPRGGGVVRAHVTPSRLGSLELLERGAILERRVIASVAGLPGRIAATEVQVAVKELDRSSGWGSPVRVERPEELDPEHGPGNVLSIEVACEHVTEVFTGFGERAVRAEEVARRAATEARVWLEAGAPVGEHLADQLLLLLALGRGGRFRTLSPTRHSTTQADILRLFLNVQIDFNEIDNKVHEVAVQRR